MTNPATEIIVHWVGESMPIEMTKREYEEQLTWYQEYSQQDKRFVNHRAQAYIKYLTDWFSDVPVDGFATVTERVKFCQLPMSFITFTSLNETNTN